MIMGDREKFCMMKEFNNNDQSQPTKPSHYWLREKRVPPLLDFTELKEKLLHMPRLAQICTQSSPPNHLEICSKCTKKKNKIHYH